MMAINPGNIVTMAFAGCLFLLTACDKYPRRGESVNRGEIIDNFNYPGCIGSIRTYTDDACIINGISDFDTLDQQSCIPAQLPVDFNAVSVIGKTIRFDCSAKIIRELSIDHANKQYNYTVNFKDAGICKRLGIAYNLVVVPKIPPGYTVNFMVHED
jgi:hypothetical protein